MQFFYNSNVFGSYIIHILYIYSTNIGTEYFKHGIYSVSFSLQNAVCFIILMYLVPVLFTFYLQSVLKLKEKFRRQKVKLHVLRIIPHCDRTAYSHVLYRQRLFPLQVVTDMDSVYCAVRVESLSRSQNFALKNFCLTFTCKLHN
jgi:hypothetical protein